MKAILCRSFGGVDALSLEDIEAPTPADDEVLIRVSAAALNFFDTLIIRNKYQYTPELPFSPGGEVAGVVAGLGRAVRGLREGDRVMAYVRCNGCREFTLAKARNVVLIPQTVSDEVAAQVTITYGTAMHAFKDRAGLRAGETVAILGAAGGAGLAALTLAHLLGARVIAAASSPDKLALCRAHGADDVLDYSREDLKQGLKTRTEGAGVDVVYDCVGGAHSEAALRAMAWEGRFLVIGFASGEIPAIPLNLLLLKGCAMLGVFWGRFAEREPERQRAHMEQVLSWCAEGRLTPPPAQIVPLSETPEALRRIAAREVKGKIVVRV